MPPYSDDPEQERPPRVNDPPPSSAGEAGARQLRAVGRHEWEQILKRARFDGVISGKAGRVEGKGGRGGVAALTFKAVAFALASYADGDTGLNVRPGDATIAVDLETSLRTVKLVKAKLVELGLLRRTRAGARRDGDPDVYQLTLPTDLLDAVEVLTPGQVRVAAKKLADESRGKRKGSSGPLTEDAVRGPEDTAHVGSDDPHAVSSGPANDSRAVSSGLRMGDPEDPPTNHDLPPNLTNHSDGDLRTDLAVARATGPDQDPIRLLVSPLADARTDRARGPDQPPPERCDHGLPAVRRADGDLACPMCRRGLPAKPSAIGPDVEAGHARARVASNYLAPVIPLHRNRPA